MEIKEVKIHIPEGYVIDEENSTFECVKFKPKSLTYEDIMKHLFHHKNGYSYIGDILCCNIESISCFATDEYNKATNATSKKQLEKLIAINKLMNVAKYLNGDWQPDWNNEYEHKYFICLNSRSILLVDSNINCIRNNVYFRTYKLAQQAIDILGEETIRLALSTDW